MKLLEMCLVVEVLSLLVVPLAVTQQAAPSRAETIVPRLMRFSGFVKDSNGHPVTGPIGITFSFYKDQEGGTALWIETQNVQADSSGHYGVLLGASKPDGLPMDLFASGEARWLGIQPADQAEQARVLLVSSPYAFKAADAETVGGLPPSAFVLATPVSPDASGGAPTTTAAAPPASTVGGTGITDFLPLWSNSTTLGSSVLFQSGTGSSAKIGINTTAPAATLDVAGTGMIRGLMNLPATGTATATAGKNSQALNLTASAFKSGSGGGAVNQNFRWQAEPASNNTSAPSGTLNLLFGAGAPAPVETGLKINNKGIITFATGQTFAGAGTISGVTAGSGLSGGGTTGSVSLSVPPGGIANAMLQHSSLTVSPGSGLAGGGAVSLGATTTLGLMKCGANQILQFIGSAWACANPAAGAITGVTAGTDLTGGGTTGNITLSLNTAATDLRYAQLGVSNTFAGDQKVTGNLTDAGNIAATGAISGQTGTFSGNNATQILSAVNSGNGAALLGSSTGPIGTAVEGTVLNGYAIVGSTSGNGVGILGTASSTTSANIGVAGFSNSSGGTGVSGSAGSSSGNTIGVVGSVNSPSGTAGVFNNNAGGSILQGTTNGVQKFLVDGNGNVNASAFLYSSPASGTFFADPTACQRADSFNIAPYQDVDSNHPPANAFGPSVGISNQADGAYNFYCPVSLTMPPGATVTLTGASMVFGDFSATCLVAADLRFKQISTVGDFGTILSTVYDGSGPNDYAFQGSTPIVKAFPAFAPQVLTSTTIVFVRALISNSGGGGDCRYSGALINYTLDRP